MGVVTGSMLIFACLFVCFYLHSLSYSINTHDRSFSYKVNCQVEFIIRFKKNYAYFLLFADVPLYLCGNLHI